MKTAHTQIQNTYKAGFISSELSKGSVLVRSSNSVSSTLMVGVIASFSVISFMSVSVFEFRAFQSSGVASEKLKILMI